MEYSWPTVRTAPFAYLEMNLLGFDIFSCLRNCSCDSKSGLSRTMDSDSYSSEPILANQALDTEPDKTEGNESSSDNVSCCRSPSKGHDSDFSDSDGTASPITSQELQGKGLSVKIASLLSGRPSSGKKCEKRTSPQTVNALERPSRLDLVDIACSATNCSKGAISIVSRRSDFSEDGAEAGDNVKSRIFKPFRPIDNPCMSAQPEQLDSLELLSYAIVKTESESYNVQDSNLTGSEPDDDGTCRKIQSRIFKSFRLIEK